MDYQFDENYEISEDKFGTTIKHPSFATLAFNRRQGGNTDCALFGSSIYHNNTIAIVIRKGQVSRGLNSDWFFGDKTILEAEMSYAQFTEAITSMNQGTGVPVTLRFTEKDGKIPPCKFVDKKKEFRTELQKDIKEHSADAEKQIATIKDMLLTKKNISKTDREEIIKLLDNLYGRLNEHTIFALHQFQEQMDKTVMEAKSEIEAFTQNKMLTIANQTLIENREKIQAIPTEHVTQNILTTLTDENPPSKEEWKEWHCRLAKIETILENNLYENETEKELLETEKQDLIKFISKWEYKLEW